MSSKQHTPNEVPGEWHSAEVGSTGPARQRVCSRVKGTNQSRQAGILSWNKRFIGIGLLMMVS
jgi:hypothetical protein